MIQQLDLKGQILNDIQDLPQSYLAEVADFIGFLRAKKNNNQILQNDNKAAMLRLLSDAKGNAPIIDPSINIRELIDQAHDREI